MLLPADFRWTTKSLGAIRRSAYRDRLPQRMGGGDVPAGERWHLDYLAGSAPLGARRAVSLCSGYEQGQAGAELWVAGHEAGLREDVAKVLEW